jgi:aminoglycoside phosphotransferase (APT) family kinase protein
MSFLFQGPFGPGMNGENDMLQENHETASLANATPLVERPPPIRAEPRRRAADPDFPEQVADGLLAYLARRFGSSNLRLRSLPVSNPDGWEAHTYNFQLDGPSLPSFAASDRPLVLRTYCSPQGVPRARHEFEVQRHLHERGYPVPEPFLLEERCDLFGGPFLIMEQLAGQNFYKYLGFYWWMMWPRSAGMAAMHARLHALPVEGFPHPEEPYLPRKLEEMRGMIRQYGLNGLLPGWKWLDVHRPPPPERPCILHLDFHPLNLLCGRFPAFAVLDWTEADVGDHHVDVGTSLMLMYCCTAGDPNLWERVGLPLARALVTHWYLSSYRKRMPLDPDKLAYYQGFAALKRLCGYGRWLRASPLSTGCKPASLRYLNPRHLETLQNFFRNRSGAAVSLLPGGAALR